MANVQEQAQIHQRSTPRHLVSQVPYQSARRQPEVIHPNPIRFVVGGEEGIRLSDALDGNWTGFEGRDDRSLFEGDRPQIIFRFQVRNPPDVTALSTPDLFF